MRSTLNLTQIFRRFAGSNLDWIALLVTCALSCAAYGDDPKQEYYLGPDAHYLHPVVVLGQLPGSGKLLVVRAAEFLGPASTDNRQVAIRLFILDANELVPVSRAEYDEAYFSPVPLESPHTALLPSGKNGTVQSVMARADVGDNTLPPHEILTRAMQIYHFQKAALEAGIEMEPFADAPYQRPRTASSELKSLKCVDDWRKLK
jgi:hypothetical protein